MEKKSTKKSEKLKNTFTFKFSKDKDLRYIMYLNQLKNKNQFLKDSIDKAINEERMQESLWDIN